MVNSIKKTIIKKNPLLVSTLEKQHKELLVLFLIITEQAKKKQFSELNQSLNDFSSLFKDHITTEREFYMYLELIVSNSDGSYHGTRAEMRDISLLVKSKLNLHLNTPIDKKTIKVFKKDFAILGKALIGRMRHEEKHLFTDYAEHAG